MPEREGDEPRIWLTKEKTMTVSLRVREESARSAHEGPARRAGGSPLIRVLSRKWFLPLLIALAASTLVSVRVQTGTDGSGPVGPVVFQALRSAEASPLLDDWGTPEPAPEELTLGEDEAVESDTETDTEEIGEETEDEAAESVYAEEVLEEGSGEEGSERVSASSRGGARPVVSMAQSVVTTAMEQLGARYRWGGTTPAGFDCSGFTMYVYGQVGIQLPRNHWGQIAVGREVGTDELQPGDLVFFENTYTWGLSHSGVYVGDNQFIHAESDWTGVVLSPLWGSGWGRHYAGASRPYEE